MRIHAVIKATAAHLERKGQHHDVDAILAQFPDIEMGDERATWNMCERIESAFVAQEEKLRASPSDISPSL